MRKSLLMSVAALGLALPAMAQTTTPDTTAPAPAAQDSGTLAATPPAGDMTGMQPMRHPHGTSTMRHATRHRAQSAQDASAPTTATGARPGHEPGVGDSYPAGDRASNIDRGDTRSDIAPRLPAPDANGNSPDAFLRAADRALSRHQTGAAQEALERAETRMLDRSVPQGEGNTPDQDPRIQQVTVALRALASRDYGAARQSIQQAMNTRGDAGMGQGGMSQGGMGQPGMDQGTMPQGQMMGQPGMAPQGSAPAAGLPR